MKIMFVIHSLNIVGGSETILTRFSNFFASMGHNISICILTHESISFELNDNINLYRYDNTNSNSNSNSNSMLPRVFNLMYQQIKYISSSINVEKPDVVISFVSGTNILSTLAAKISNKPIILAERSSYDLSLKNKFWKLLRRLVYPLATKSIVLTEEDRPKYSYVKEVFVVPNPLTLKQNYTNIEREKTILSVGRLHHVKGFDMLIKAFSKLDTNGWKLVIAGEGEERESLEALINKLDISDKVILPGLIKDIELYYKKSSIYVLSSRSEGYPGALCEAMGYGCSCIAFDCVTGPKEIITDNIDGLLVEANNIDNLSISIQQLIDDKYQRELLGNKAKEIVQRLNMEAIAQKWEDIMKKAIKDYKE